MREREGPMQPPHATLNGNSLRKRDDNRISVIKSPREGNIDSPPLRKVARETDLG